MVRKVRTDREGVATICREAAEIRRRIIASRFNRQLGETLLDLGTLDLQQGRLRTRSFTRLSRSEATKLSEFECSEIDFQLRDFLGEVMVLD